MHTLNVAIAGLGTIGAAVAQALDRGIDGLNLAAVTSGSVESARREVARLQRVVPIVSAAELPNHADIVVDCAPTAAFPAIASGTLDAGRKLLTVSGAAILEHPELVQLAAQRGGQIILATGALLAFDAVRAAAEGTIHSVHMVTRKPPKSLVKAKYVIEQGIDLSNLDEPVLLFKGSARDGARNFPSNVNVAAALALAGIGADATRLEIWADPALTRNTHFIDVDADSAKFSFQIQNIPTENNPGTGRITALSVIAALRGLVAPLRVGS